jgi:hypothetical protein
MLIYANKSDVPGSLNTTQLSEALNIRVKGRNWTLISSSEKTGIGIKVT